MPWGKKIVDGKHCVYKKTTGKVMHCYDNESEANDYLAALHMHASEKELQELIGNEGSKVVTFKEADGRYKIIGVSTVALKDREGETMDVESIDYDAALAERTGDYPEFRLYHKKALGVGKVETMHRVGIFAVDEGHSYTDPFSLEICEKMLANNDGRWRMSRGFYVLEASGSCPVCAEDLVVQTKHMVAGFKCPSCNSYHSKQGVLKELHFRKTKTFDDTITDNPAVPWTGVTAFQESMYPEVMMNKKQLKEKLLAAGVNTTVVEEKLATLTDAQLKEFTDIPFAQVLKEFDAEADEDTGEEYEVLQLDEASLKEFGTVVHERVLAIFKELLPAMIKKEVSAAIEGLEIDVADMPDLEIDFKEMPAFQELVETVAQIKEAVEALTVDDEKRLKGMLTDMPRAGKLRIRRYKKGPPADAEEDDDDDEEDDGEESYEEKQLSSGVIVDSDGRRVANMTEFILGSKK